MGSMTGGLLLLLLGISSLAYATRVNIAYNKPTSQSTTVEVNIGGRGYRWDSSFAVDGRTEMTSDTCQCCSGTATTPGWWELDLEELYNIGRIEVYGRPERPDQTWGFKLYVSETPNATANGEEVYVNNVTRAEYEGNGAHFIIPLGEINVRYVSVSLPWYLGMDAADRPSWYERTSGRTGSPPLVICEVEVYPSCTQYQFEPDCTTCHCDGASCDRKTGICPSGICLPGWTGPSCSQG